MTISNTTRDDLPVIREMFHLAIRYQQSKSIKPWQGMNEALIEKEIDERLHWKILDESRIACCFSVVYSDPLVWDERDADPSIYLHRIVTHPAFRGRGYVKNIISWAEDAGAAAGKRFIRLDTGRENARLNAYYVECGFAFCGVKVYDSENYDPRIPAHYLGAGLSLYEKEIPLYSPQK